MRTQQLDAQVGSRPEAMADVPGACQLPLTRAVVQYRDVHEVDVAGGRIQDIGLALVLEGRYASSAQVLDLGSAEVKRLDLSHELVLLDWVYEPTLEHVAEMLETRAVDSGRDLSRYCFDLALRVLDRVGFGPLSRPILLRIGFRDVCRDLDLHEGTSVRIALGSGRLARAHLDYDACALGFRTVGAGRDRRLEEALFEAFPGRDVRRVEPVGEGGSVSYQVRFPLPTSLAETRTVLGAMREGLSGLLARFEPRRYEAIQDVLSAFGDRGTLAHLRIREERTRSVPLHLRGTAPGIRTVH